MTITALSCRSPNGVAARNGAPWRRLYSLFAACRGSRGGARCGVEVIEWTRVLYAGLRELRGCSFAEPGAWGAALSPRMDYWIIATSCRVCLAPTGSGWAGRAGPGGRGSFLSVTRQVGPHHVTPPRPAPPSSLPGGKLLFLCME